METWKILTIITVVSVLSAVVTGLAFANYYNSKAQTPLYTASNGFYPPGPQTYSPPTVNGSQYPSQYPNYPTAPNYPSLPTYPQQPAYPQPYYPPPYYPPAYGYPYGGYGYGEHGGYGTWSGMG